METATNREIALRFTDAWNRQDFEALKETLALDVVVVRPRGTTVSRDEFLAAVTAPSPAPVADELVVSFRDRTVDAAGDKVVTTVTLDYHWRESGDFSHSMRRRTEFTISGGKIVELRFGAPKPIDG